MDPISLAEAKAHLSGLVAQAGTGTAVRITRRGGPADLETPRALTAAMPRQTQSAQALAREMRDGDRVLTFYPDTTLAVAALAA